MLVRVLGSVDVVDDSGTSHAPASALRRTLLALLALHPGSVLSADWLMESLWSGEPPESGLRALRFHVSQLRKELPDADLIDTRPGGYRLSVTADQVDALTIERAARVARTDTDRQRAADSFSELLLMWRDAPFVDAAPCAALDDEAARLAELRLSLVEEQLQARIDSGAGRELIADLTRATAQHPLRESLWSMLITAQYRSGMQADALRTYEQMRSLLADSLGLDPSTELQQLQQRVLQHDPTLMPRSAAPTDAPATGDSTTRAVAESAYIEVVAGDGVRSLYTLLRSRYTIGRSPQGDLVIDDPSVSSVHALLEHLGDGWFVEDLGSRNGTFVDGTRVDNRRGLRPGSEIRLGLARLTMHGTAPVRPETEVVAEPPVISDDERQVLVALCKPLISGDAFTAPASIGEIAAQLMLPDVDVTQRLESLYDKFAIVDGDRRPVRLANAVLSSGAVALNELRSET